MECSNGGVQQDGPLRAREYGRRLVRVGDNDGNGRVASEVKRQLRFEHAWWLTVACMV